MNIPVKGLGVILSVAGAVISIVQGVIGEKNQTETIKKEVEKAIKEMKETEE